MKTLIKIFFSLVLIVIIVAAIAGAYVYVNRAPMLGRYLSQKMGTTVTIESIDFDEDSFTLNNLMIKNPPGNQLPTAFKVKTIEFKAPFDHYFKKHIEIDAITLNDIYLSLEFHNKQHTKGNWTTIIQNIDSNYSSTYPPESQKSSEKKSLRKHRTVMIKKLLFYNIEIEIFLYGDKPRQLSPIAAIELENVSGKEGIPTEEITEIIVQKMMEQVSSIKGLTNMLISVPATAVKAVFTPFTVIFGGGSSSTD